jgi:hypothetical protein
MRNRNAALFVVGFLSINFWLLRDSAQCQTSLAPPLSLARPAPLPDKNSAPTATTNSALPPVTTDDIRSSTATTRRAAPKVDARDTRSPKPTADYDGITVGIDNERAPTLPVRPRRANQSKLKQESADPAARQSFDQEEEQILRGKLMICRDCK